MAWQGAPQLQRAGGEHPSSRQWTGWGPEGGRGAGGRAGTGRPAVRRGEPVPAACAVLLPRRGALAGPREREDVGLECGLGDKCDLHFRYSGLGRASNVFWPSCLAVYSSRTIQPMTHRAALGEKCGNFSLQVLNIFILTLGFLGDLRARTKYSVYLIGNLLHVKSKCHLLVETCSFLIK